MSTTLQRPAVERPETKRSEPARHRASPVSPRLQPQIVLAVFCGALALRLFRIGQAYNTFLDEITYSQIAHNLGSGNGLTLYGQPFSLHPPVAFALFSGVARVMGLTHTGTADLAVDLRPVVAVFGAATVVVAMLVTRACRAGTPVVVAVTALVALDPFEISFDSRVLLEAVAQLFVIAAIACLIALVRRPEIAGLRRLGLVGAAGLSAGLAFSTKETFGLVLGVTLLLVLGLPRLLPRRVTLTVLGLGVACYLLASGAVWLTYGFEPWWQAHSSGFQRLVGTKQNTGFNAATTKVSLSSRVAANLHDFGVTYLLLAAGGVTTIVTLIRSKPWQGVYAGARERCRMIVSLWNLAACGYLVYATLFGSIEEQMYYIPLVPCILSLGLAVSAWQPRRWLSRGVAALVVLAVVFQAFVWTSVRHTDNNSYQQFFLWERSHVLAGARIAVAEDTAQFVLQQVTVGKWTTLAQLRANNADYALVDRSLVDQGYSTMSEATLTYLLRHDHVAFRSSTRGGDVLYFFDLRGGS